MTKHRPTLYNSYSLVLQPGLSDHLTRVCWSFLVQDLKLKVTEPLRLQLRHFGTLSHQA
ncbi:hypothetical protein LDENG_00076410 [Lucifuga dentata]|nr:hypothetical protein LDENG_00076410 [Lucifuga dentata]